MSRQEPSVIALGVSNLPAHRIHQLKVEAEHAHVKVHEGLFIRCRNGLLLARFCQDGWRKDLLGRRIPFVVTKRVNIRYVLGINAENIDFVGIPQDLAKEALPRRQVRPQTIHIVLANGDAEEVILVRRCQEIPDVPLFKEIVHTVPGVVHRAVINKRIVLAQLLKTAYIVEDAETPGQVLIFWGQAQGPGNTPAEHTYAQRMAIFEAHSRISCIKGAHIGSKGLENLRFIDFHRLRW